MLPVPNTACADREGSTSWHKFSPRQQFRVGGTADDQVPSGRTSSGWLTTATLLEFTGCEQGKLSLNWEGLYKISTVLWPKAYKIENLKTQKLLGPEISKIYGCTTNENALSIKDILLYNYVPNSLSIQYHTELPPRRLVSDEILFDWYSINRVKKIRQPQACLPWLKARRSISYGWHIRPRQKYYG